MRKRLRRVDDVIAAVAESGVETRSLSRAIALPKEHEMEARGQHQHSDPELIISNDKTSTRRLVRTEEDLGRVYTRCQSGQRSVFPSMEHGRIELTGQLTLRENPKGF